MRCALLFSMLGLAACGTGALAQDRAQVQDARLLLVAAIDAADGQAHGVLIGDMAAAITQRFKAPGPINIDVSTERRFAQRGCSRLKVRFWQDGVQLPGVPSAPGVPSPRRQTIDFGINYCRDGLPPKSLV